MNPPVNRPSESPRPKQSKKTKPPEEAPSTEASQVVTPEETPSTEVSQVVTPEEAPSTEASQIVTPEPPSQPVDVQPIPPQTPLAPKFAPKSPDPPPVKLNQPISTPPVAPVEGRTPLPKPSKPIKLKSGEDSMSSEGETAEIDRNQPIPPPSHPRQYRAIGLVQGQYQRSEEQLTKGNIITPDGTALDAVVLGRVISLVKNHLDLEKPHLWVVYPRTRQEDDHLHVQIVGVWEPETLSKETPEEGEAQDDETALSVTATPNPGYFSIRGEVIFASQEDDTVIIKIRQSPKKDDERPKFFKLKLKGTLPSNRPFKRFWDLQVQLQGSSLLIQQGQDLGFASKRKPFDRRGGGGGSFGQKRPFRRDSEGHADSRPFKAEGRPEGTGYTPGQRPVPSKPVRVDPEQRKPE